MIASIFIMGVSAPPLPDAPLPAFPTTQGYNLFAVLRNVQSFDLCSSGTRMPVSNSTIFSSTIVPIGQKSRRPRCHQLVADLPPSVRPALDRLASSKDRIDHLLSEYAREQRSDRPADHAPESVQPSSYPKMAFTFVTIQ